MEVVILPSATDVGRVVADAIGLVLCRRAVPVLGLATGSAHGPTHFEVKLLATQGPATNGEIVESRTTTALEVGSLALVMSW